MSSEPKSPARIKQGRSPVILAMPHVGTEVPDDIVHKLNEEGRTLQDTDWHVDKLYEGLLPEATIVRATYHRYVIDLNRDPKNVSLYPGQNTTDLVPRVDFDNVPIWKQGREPDAAEIERRVATFHAPYHQALVAEIARVKAEHGVVLLYDCHSIRSVVPFLFEGTLPDFNIGTDNGKTCAPEFERAAVDVCKHAAEGAEGAGGAGKYSYVLNGRFRGGWTTRHYGQPTSGVHAIQMELAQKNYLASEDAPFFYDGAKAEGLRAYLKKVVEEMQRVALSLKR